MAAVVAPTNHTKSIVTVIKEGTTAKASEVKDLFKLLGYVFKWMQIDNPNLPANYVAIGDLGANGKNFLSGLEIFRNVSEIVDAISEKQRAYTIVASVCDLSNNVGDLMKLLSRFFTIPHMKHIEGGSGAFTLVGAINKVWQHACDLFDPKNKSTDEQINFWRAVCNTINVISDVCYIGVGSLAVATWLGLFVVPPVVMLALLSLALLSALINFVIKNLKLPDENPDTKVAVQIAKRHNWTMPAPIQIPVA